MKHALKNPHDDPQWKGFTIDELRYRRAYTLALIEVERSRLRGAADSIRHGHPDGLLGKVWNSLGYLKYVIVGFKAYSTIKKLTGKMRRR